MQTRNIKRIELSAKKWFDSFGNTYHSCEIYVNDNFVHKIDFCYGGGSHYETTSLQWLIKNYFSKQLKNKLNNHVALWRICEEIIKCKFISRSYDVNRKKDL